MKTKFTAISIIALLLLSVSYTIESTSTPARAVTSTIGIEDCYPTVLLLRGSGEENISRNLSKRNYIPESSTTGLPLVSTEGWEGPRIERLLQAFANETDPSKTTSKVRFVDIDYPAYDFGDGGDLKRFGLSHRQGGINIIDFIQKDRTERIGINRYFSLKAPIRESLPHVTCIKDEKRQDYASSYSCFSYSICLYITT